MELTALLNAQQWLVDQAQEESVVIFTDSTYCVDGLYDWSERWEKAQWMKKGEEIKNADLWRGVVQLKKRLVHVEVEWVRGHSGNSGNVRADKLASLGAEVAMNQEFDVAEWSRLRRA